MTDKVLISGWRKVLLHAWSVRLILLAGVLEIADQILPWLADWFPGKTYPLVQTIILVAALIVRVLPQRNLPDEA